MRPMGRSKGTLPRNPRVLTLTEAICARYTTCMKKLSVTKKKPVKKVGTRKKTASNKARPLDVHTFGKHIHPYGTAKHTDGSWHGERLTSRIGKMSAADQALIQKAITFATEKHEGQFRRGGAPYVIHPIRIANILLQEWSCEDPNVVCAALLHDVVEDTPTTIKEVKDAFGNEIGKLVDGMTMWKGSETYEVYVKRVSRGPEELRMIKCADVLDNLRSWYETESDDGFARWWRNTEELILPMAMTVSKETAVAIQKVLADPWYLKKAGME